MQYDFIHSKKLVLEPKKSSNWASEMVLNPAILKDNNTNRIHMLFRATGPFEHKQIEGKPLPYPIFLGYGWSDDDGDSWNFDLECPALAPKLEYKACDIYIKNSKGEKVVNYANGAIEDPRMFYFEGDCYAITACRMFPPGPYWEHDCPTQCVPDWCLTEDNPFGVAASENYTVNVLWRVNLEQLTNGKYHEAFEYVVNLTNPAFGEDRDVLIFPQRLMIDGKKKIVMVHRPQTPGNYPMFEKNLKPSIAICAADNFCELASANLHREVLASPVYQWENEKIGGSAPPIIIGEGEWLMSYHGKQDQKVGYAQSFMILKEQNNGFPIIKHRPSQKLITPNETWEMPNKFETLCLFLTGLLKLDNTLLAAYGAADEKVGILKIDYTKLIKYLENN